MQLFSCAACGQPVHFDNRSCVKCGHRLVFVPETLSMEALEPAGEPNWTLVSRPQKTIRFCANEVNDICNWSVPAESENKFCPACSHNRLVPDTSMEEGIEQWRRLSQAQRHLFYSMLRLNLPHPNRDVDPQGGLVFDFLVDEVAPDGSIIPAMTGHDEGLIAIRAAEADDATREQIKSNMNEPYRTMLGHFRHEVGHFIWNKLVRDANRLEPCRAVFGDDTLDYGEALKRNYEQGPQPGWQQNYISSYASVHPWEDFAECFAHYLHIVDTLETAHAFGIAIEPEGHQELDADVAFEPYRARSAQQLVNAWIPLSVALNSMQRSMGEADLYPFVLTPAVVDKLQFMHDLLHGNVASQQQSNFQSVFQQPQEQNQALLTT
ncbi:zinc-binding metallopeptidase family protein [Agrobacterium sp. rho-13.3]|uniref:zinc-binding metallopeptidase family protein n=1 Tax=Agrobacterium sp. rho-13.3 TaxID=3072980 RepID=UPI002A175C20|nr:putative zinc-binding metallopeptidase [Agrobacterium sp. rho-13.3]MDX8308604.1 putative zinc-binding metallopeptidase [Agrobacterium sp. rho-13.3]